MSTNLRASRPYDILLWGATGFTGQLVAEYLARTYGVGRDLRWALGGRNREKLAGVRAGLASADANAASLQLVVGDSRDRPALDHAVSQAHVVVSTVGPYAVHGAELVAACVDAGSAYCDLTGEPPFVRDMIDRHHARAKVTGARIVHSCGYDSIPSDLGTLVTQKAMTDRSSVPCAAVKCFAGEQRGGISGGTIASMLHMAEAAQRERSVRRVLSDPYSLVPGGERGPDGMDQLGVGFDRDLGRFTGPFVMASINARIVRRTNALLDYAYGRDFHYTEAMTTGRGVRGLVTAGILTLGTAGALAGASIPPLRHLAEKYLPGPGTGPSKAARDNGFFVTRLVGTAAGGATPSRGDSHKAQVLVTVRGKGDPGYGATSRMLAESAVCLALDGDVTGRAGGVLTPGSAMGMRLVERLRGAGIAFDVGA